MRMKKSLVVDELAEQLRDNGHTEIEQLEFELILKQYIGRQGYDVRGFHNDSRETEAEDSLKYTLSEIKNGNIKNSVNYPNCDMGTCVAVGRISLAHSNTPNMISQVTKILGSEGLNIADMTNKSKGEFAYTLIDLESAASAKALDELKEIEGMYRVRVVK